jgi:hypothetical protein
MHVIDGPGGEGSGYGGEKSGLGDAEPDLLAFHVSGGLA